VYIERKINKIKTSINKNKKINNPLNSRLKLNLFFNERNAILFKI